MKTSADLFKSNTCPNHADVVQVTDAMIRARAVKRAAIDAIMGDVEHMDIKGLILSRLTAAGYAFESLDQMLINLNKFEEAVGLTVHWIRQKEAIGWRFERIAKDEDTVIDYFGTEIKALPDFIATTPDGNSYSVQIKASKDKPIKDDYIPEAYCLASYANNIKSDPEGHAAVIKLFMFDKQSNPAVKTEEMSYAESLAQAREIHEARQATANERCSGEDCERCPMNSICNYEDPPLAQNTLRDITPSQTINLSTEQQAVVNFNEGIARVNAGPGAGKTLVVAFRVRQLLQSGVPASKIALLTFTRAGAEEMTTRIKQYCDEAGVQFDPAEMTCGTFNSFCMDMIQENYLQLGFLEPPRLLDDSTKYDICNRILAQFPRIQAWNYGGFADNILSLKFTAKSQAISSLIDAFATLKAGREPNVPFGTLPQIKAMYDRYQSELDRMHYIEFDDQIVLVKKLGEIDPDFYNRMGYEHIIVDEFQDTDLKQIELLQKMIRGEQFRSFMAVGDDSQSIFGFRFTTPEYMINFDRYFGEFTDLNLLTCRRCPQPIVNLANRINGLRLSRAAEAPLVTPKQSDLAPAIKGFYKQEDEIKFICDSIEQDIANGVRSHEIAVLTRDKNEIAAVAAELANRGVPATICNPVPYIRDSRVAAICAFWESWMGEGDLGVAAYINALEHGSLKNASPEDIMAAVNEYEFPETRDYAGFIAAAEALDGIDGDDQFDACYRDFLDKIKRNRNYEELQSFFRTFKLYGVKDAYRRDGVYEGVCLTTVHSAKGREWDVTYLTLSNFDKAAYHKRETEFRNSGEYDENLRLWFVGATRAKVKLVMTGLFQFKTRDETFRNQYVEQAYTLLNRPYEFNPRVANQIEEEARQEAAARRSTNTRTRTRTAATTGRRRTRTAANAEPDPNARVYEPMTQAELEAINVSVFDLIDEQTPEPAAEPARQS